MSNTIHTPSVVSVTENDEQHSATFTIEPLHTGYGMTLGNSLRRVLLSSISGGAITGFKVEGASHEFTTLPGVKEDVVDIMLNLKGIRFKLFSDEAITLRLAKKGSGKVTAGDIELGSEVEIANPDHIIATLDGDKSELVMDIVVESGRGYRSNEDGSGGSKTSDLISVDAIFSPVRRVRYKVENTRVGQVTDLDKLIITVDTDGTISPRDAFEEAAAILVNQYTTLAGKTRVEAVPQEIEDGQNQDEAAEESSELMTPIEDLNLSARTTNALINNDIYTLKDLFALNDAELRELKGFGSKALDEVKDKLTELEL